MSEEKQLIAVDTESLIAKAIEKNLPVETMERLLAMRRELKEEWAREEYFRALAKFQKECPIIPKKEEVHDKSGKLRYRFAPLGVIVDTIKILLEKHGFSYIVQTRQEKEAVTSICIVHHIAGHSESSEFQVPIDPEAYMNAAQKVASAQTYSKRYAFCNAFGILTGDEDDDARATSEHSEKNENEEAQILYIDLNTLLDSDGLDKSKVDAMREKMELHREDARFLKEAIRRVKQEIERQERLLDANIKGEQIEGSQEQLEIY